MAPQLDRGGHIEDVSPVATRAIHKIIFLYDI